MTSLDDFARAKLDRIRAAALDRRTVPTVRDARAGVTREGRRLISFSCNDYLNLAHHPEVKARAREAIELYGTGAAASRMVTGDHPLMGELETRLARLKGTEAALVFGSGFLANIGIIPCFTGPDDVIFMDELCHACLFAGAKLSAATVHVFRHNDMAHLAELLATHRGQHPHALILTDGVFSMDGDLAPLDQLGPLAEAHDAWLLTDDAHGVGVLGAGRGSSFIGSEKARVPLQMGTLSKAIGSYGGYLCASTPVIDFVRNRARSIVFTTGLPPASAAAAIAALDIIECDAALRAEPVRKARLFAARLGLPTPETCIVPVIIGAADQALAASKALEAQGFLVVAIRPPTVAEGTARLRITFTAAHDDADVIRLTEAITALAILPARPETV
ncbi:8-amino-7-oxononanoate synthase [Govanella unica]|uniref:8-amino-7-ketopelargonate synthase n=1 Tax=Govanella unica TaxID=2975056 RepID=A0A9X3Z5X3_9PROT|nr:8-amino-7-oxononanoate synthase [Govania unica]MDA5192482.1 8-amino-7-oxononanoate synthase [Govania unica]